MLDPRLLMRADGTPPTPEDYKRACELVYSPEGAQEAVRDDRRNVTLFDSTAENPTDPTGDAVEFVISFVADNYSIPWVADN